MNRNTVEIMRIINMLQENNESCSLDGIYVCSYYTFKNDLREDLDALVSQGVLIHNSDGCYKKGIKSC